MVSGACTPLPVLMKVLAALRMVKDMPIDAKLSPAQFIFVAQAHNELEGHIDGLQLDAKADAAITRGPQIAKAMGVRLPARSM